MPVLPSRLLSSAHISWRKPSNYACIFLELINNSYKKTLPSQFSPKMFFESLFEYVSRIRTFYYRLMFIIKYSGVQCAEDLLSLYSLENVNSFRLGYLLELYNASKSVFAEKLLRSKFFKSTKYKESSCSSFTTISFFFFYKKTDYIEALNIFRFHQ